MADHRRYGLVLLWVSTARRSPGVILKHHLATVGAALLRRVAARAARLSKEIQLVVINGSILGTILITVVGQT